jgi:hypothetical protein
MMSEFDGIEEDDGSIKDKFNNYIYTVIEHITKVRLDTVKRKDRDYSVRSYNVLELSDNVVRSYSDKNEAEKISNHLNVDGDFYDFNYVTAWAKTEFGTGYVKHVTGPDNFAQIVTVHKFYYVENELFGSVLEKDQSWD